ncbi:MAG: HDOD domain-containing protein [Mariprofundaceae bacterium]
MQQEPIVIGRHPIYDRSRKVVAYKLLFRANAKDTDANFMDSDHATAKVLVNSVINFGLDKVAWGKQVYVSLSRDFLLGEFPSLLPPDAVVLEVVADVQPDDEVIRACQAWRSKGFRIAFELNGKNRAHMDAIMEIADIVKVDASMLGEDELALEAEVMCKRSVKLLAQKIETADELVRAKSLGFNYFQGFLFCKPDVLKGSVVSVSKMGLLQVLQATYAAENINDIEKHVAHDLTLSYQLLRYINSVGFGRSQEVASINQALSLLGLIGIRNWLTLMMYASVDTQMPTEVVAKSLMRGRILENLAEAQGKHGRKSDYFVLGMFSLLDQLLNLPMEEAIASLTLPQDVREGLLNANSMGGNLIDLARSMEQGDWEELDHDCKKAGVDSNLVMIAYSDACYWVDEQMRHLGSA